MKKVLVLVIFLLSVAFVLASCGESKPHEPTAHTHTAGEPVRENEAPATCKKKGSYDEVVYCSGCDVEMSRMKKSIAKTDVHSPAAPITENEVLSTCEKSGGYDKVIYCSLCETELERTALTSTARLPHELKNNRCVSCKKQASVGLGFRYNGGRAIVIGIGNCTDSEIIIPDVAPNGYPVTEIGSSAFKNKDSIASVFIPGSVTDIAYEAFSGCTKLEEVVLSEGLTQIGPHAFESCEALKTVNFPSTLQRISNCSFAACFSLTSITIPESLRNIDGDAFIFCFRLAEVINESKYDILPGSDDHGKVAYYAIDVHNGRSRVSENGDGFVFYNGEDSTYLVAYFGKNSDVDIPKSFDKEDYKIRSYAFYNNATLRNVTVPSGVTAIGSQTFAFCTAMVSLELPDTLKEIGSFAFIGCSEIETVEIPESVESIGEGILESCDSLTTLTLPFVGRDGTGTDAFYYTFGSAKYSTVGSVPKTLKTVVITGGSALKSRAFYDCNNIVNISLPETLTSIGREAFLGCEMLQFTERDGVIYLGNDNNPYVALISASGATGKCSINSKTVVIAARAFEGSEITDVKLPRNINKISEEAFYGCSKLTEVSIPNKVTMICDYAFYGCVSLLSIDIPSGVTSIGRSAFEKCESLTEIIIPDSVTAIGNKAFVKCGFSSVEIPASVTSIGDYAFIECPKLISVTFKSKDVAMGEGVFGDCCALKSITLPSELPSIGSNTFWYCTSLESITLPGSVTKIGALAFVGCDSLTNVIFENTSGWKAGESSISASNLADSSTAAKYLTDEYCSYYWNRG